MSSSLLFNFNVDKNINTVWVNKEFAAERALVWDAFTRAEILDQWWAPKPLMSRTKHMDFRVGGRRFYAMVSPDGTEIAWQTFTYTSITPQSNFKCLGVFADQDEAPNPPPARWDLTFGEHTESNQEVITKLSISIYFESLAELEKAIAMGFKEGFTMTLTELASLLKTLKK